MNHVVVEAIAFGPARLPELRNEHLNHPVADVRPVVRLKDRAPADEAVAPVHPVRVRVAEGTCPDGASAIGREFVRKCPKCAGFRAQPENIRTVIPGNVEVGDGDKADEEGKERKQAMCPCFPGKQ